jgi:hypothetical protein
MIWLEIQKPFREVANEDLRGHTPRAGRDLIPFCETAQWGERPYQRTSSRRYS